ncbi:MAG: hypothetical protein ACE5H4_07745, partial [Candidatus Thorarchaeota archaeon]
MATDLVPTGRRPIARACSRGQRELLRIGLPLVVVIFLLIPLFSTPGLLQPQTERISLVDGPSAPATNLIRVNLPYYVHSVAAGNTTHGRGVAWIFNDTLRFKDPVNLVDASVNIGIGDPVLNTLIGADIDTDGHTEFLFMKSNLTNMNLVVVDFDTGSATEYNYDPVPNPRGIIVGDFNGDVLIDVGVYNLNRVVMKDLNGDAIIGGFVVPVNATLVKAVVGNFSTKAGEEVGVLYITGGTGMPIANVDTMYGNGTVIDHVASLAGVWASDMISFEYENDLDNVAVAMVDDIASESILTVLNANLTLRFEIRNTKYHGPAFVKTGYFDMDSQVDLVVVPGQYYTMYFAN